MNGNQTTDKTEEGLRNLIEFYEKLKAETVARAARVYADDATFRDPFNDVRGIPAIRHVLERMFESLTDVRFTIREAIRQDSQAFLVWDMAFRMKRRPAKLENIHGASHIRFDAAGKVSCHRDYWDAGEEVYEKIPVLGAVIRMVKRKIG